MKCSNCNREYDNARFCPYCGAQRKSKLPLILSLAAIGVLLAAAAVFAVIMLNRTPNPATDSTAQTLTVQNNGSSMENTIMSGENLTVNKQAVVKPGDIIVFTKDGNRDITVVKRVIATEGQKLRLDYDNDAVYVDGVKIDEPYIKDGQTFGPNKPSLDFLHLDKTGSIIIPEGKLFVMGDNRMNSLDSRSETVGLIDKENVLGVVELP